MWKENKILSRKNEIRPVAINYLAKKLPNFKTANNVDNYFFNFSFSIPVSTEALLKVEDLTSSSSSSFDPLTLRQWMKSREKVYSQRLGRVKTLCDKLMRHPNQISTVSSGKENSPLFTHGKHFFSKVLLLKFSGESRLFLVSQILREI